MTTSSTSEITEILNGVAEVIKHVVPVPTVCEPAKVLEGAILQSEMGVLVGITGTIRGRLVVEAEKSVFSAIGLSLYGMPLEGEMLESFVGELGNMIGGNLCTHVSKSGLSLDITPPTVLVGETKLTGFDKAFWISVSLPETGEMKIIVILEE